MTNFLIYSDPPWIKIVPRPLNITFKFQIHISRHILTFLLLSLSHIFFYLGRDSWIFFINYTVNLQGSKTKTRADEEVEVRQKWTKVSCRFLALVRCGIQWVLNNGNKTNIPKNEMSIPSMYTVLILDLTFLFLFEIGFKSILNQFKPNNNNIRLQVILSFQNHW